MSTIKDLSAVAPAPDDEWIPDDIDGYEARWCLQHLITEIARHVGHADIIREGVDGMQSYELNAAADAEQ